MKTFAISMGCLGLLMIFTWAEESMLLACQATLLMGGTAILVHQIGIAAERRRRRPPLEAAADRRPG